MWPSIVIGSTIRSRISIARATTARTGSRSPPASAVRIDNDVFLGSPLPPEEPVAKNPPDGAIIDYYLPSAARKVTLDILDPSGKLVRHFSSDPMKEPQHPPMVIAERWIPKPI